MKKNFLLKWVIFIITVSILTTPFLTHASKKIVYSDFFSRDDEQILTNMNLEQKIGQILMFGFWGSSLDKDYQTWLSSSKLGNIKIFLRNVKSEEQLKELTYKIASLSASSPSGIPPFIATDIEGGTVNHIRYNGVSIAPAAGLIGSTGNIDYCRTASRVIALTLFNFGINMNFAPCIDVLTNPDNRVIGTRSYSSNPEIVEKMAEAFIEEHRKIGILSVVKHFPGHGMADFDSHLISRCVDTPFLDLSWYHLYPYAKLIGEQKLDGCMVAHITYNALDPYHPAAFSKKIIDLIREQMGFEGIFITDDLEMDGAQEYANGLKKAFSLAFKAGNDILLVAHTKKKQAQLIKDAVELFKSGELNIEELNRKVLRIIRIKKKYLSTFYENIIKEQDFKSAFKEAEDRSNKIFREGITLLSSNIKKPIPDFFQEVVKNGIKGVIIAPSVTFERLAKNYLPFWDVINIDYYPDREKNQILLNDMKDTLSTYEMAILGLANERQIDWANACFELHIPLAILSIDKPLFTRSFNDKALFIATSFSPYSPSIDALFDTVFKTGDFKGILPYYYDSSNGTDSIP